MAIHLPTFITILIAHVANPANPQCNEVNDYHLRVSQWSVTVQAHLLVLHPQPRVQALLPVAILVDDDPDTHLPCLNELMDYTCNLFAVYATAYGQFTQALAGIPPPTLPALPAAVHHVPKTQLPDWYNGKSPALGCQFIRQCNNYATLHPFPDEGMQIRWTLQLLEGEAAQWRDEQLEELDLGFPLNHLAYWVDFLIEFRQCWMDPHEGEKALDRLQKGEI